MNIVTFFVIIAVVFALCFMHIDSSKSSRKERRSNRRHRDYDDDLGSVKQLKDVAKRMELLHQEQEISRMSARFTSDSVSKSPTIKLHRNF